MAHFYFFNFTPLYRLDQEFNIVEGTYIRNVSVFAGKGTKKVLRIAEKYANKYGGKVEDWQHCKGIAILNSDDGQRDAEIHWVQCEGIGAFDHFIKRWLDE